MPELINWYDSMDIWIYFVPSLDAVIQRDAPESMLRVVDEAWPQTVAFILRAEEEIFGLMFCGQVSRQKRRMCVRRQVNYLLWLL